jgi:hypothetical protein
MCIRCPPTASRRRPAGRPTGTKRSRTGATGRTCDAQSRVRTCGRNAVRLVQRNASTPRCRPWHAHLFTSLSRTRKKKRSAPASQSTTALALQDSRNTEGRFDTLCFTNAGSHPSCAVLDCTSSRGQRHSVSHTLDAHATAEVRPRTMPNRKIKEIDRWIDR